MQHDNVAELVARHPRRFVGMATVPLQDTALAIEELHHARERLGLRAVEIGTCPAGRDFDDPALFPFFNACWDLDMAVLVHPAAPLVGQERLTKYYSPLIVGSSQASCRNVHRRAADHRHEIGGERDVAGDH